METKDLAENIKRMRAERRFDEIISLLEEKLKENPKDEELLNLLADTYADKGDFLKAREVMDRLISINSRNKSYWLKRSVFRFKMDEREGALDDVMKAHEIDPHDINVIKARIDVNAALGNYETALEIIENVSVNYTDGSIFERKRNLLKLLKMREESDPYNFLLDAMRSSIKEDHLLIAHSLLEKIKEKRNADYYETACVLYKKMGMPHKVIELAHEAEKDKKTNDKVRRTLAFAYMDLQKFEDAEKVFDELIEKASDDHMLYADRAVARMNLGNLKGALEDIDIAIKLQPHKDVYFIRKGDIIARVEGVQAAIAYYKEAIRLNPLNEEAHERKESAEAIVYRSVKESDKKLFR